LSLAGAWPAGSALAATTQTVTGSFNFDVAGQPIWAGAIPVFDKDLASIPVGPSIGPDAVVTLAGFQFGATANFSVGIDIALRSQLRDFQVGTVAVNYPIDVQLTFPTHVDPGETFSISSSYSVAPGAGFTSSANQAKLDLGARLGAFANLTFRACVFDCFVDEQPINWTQPIGVRDLITQSNTETTLHVFDDINAAVSGLKSLGLIPPGTPDPLLANPTIPGDAIVIDPSNPFSFPDGTIQFVIGEVTNVSGTVGAPDHVIVGVPDPGGALRGANTDIFADVDVDLDGFLKTGGFVLGFGPVNIGDLTIGADVFDATLNTQLIERMAQEFLPVPVVELDLGSLGTHLLALGESIDLTAPLQAGKLDITPTFRLLNTFTNVIDVAAAQATEITVGGLTLSLPPVTVLEGTPDITIPGTPSFCLIPNPFGGCAVRYPGTSPVTIPGIPPLEFGGLNFDEAIYRESITDDIFGLGVDTCVVAPQVCDTLPLFGQSGARTAERYVSSQSFAFQSFVGETFSISVPEPGTLALSLAALAAAGWGRARRQRAGAPQAMA